MLIKTNSRTQNAVRNAIFGMINRIVYILSPFIIRTIIIYKLGVEYVGLSSLFSSILQVLSVTELGFSSAIIFSLYKPVADDDVEEINGLMTVYRTIYRIVGTIILIIGLVMIPYLRGLIHGRYPNCLDIYVLYLLYLSNTVISYLAFGYKATILTVYQRNDILSKIDTGIIIARTTMQAFVLLYSKNFYLYVLTLPVFTLISNIVINCITNNAYPNIRCKSNSLQGIGRLSSQIKGAALGKISLICRNSFDSIILSYLFGLTLTAVYSNYYYVFSSVSAFSSVLLQSMAAGVGNSIACESVEKNYADHMRFDFYFQCLSGFCTICLACLYQHFMRLWVGESLMLPCRSMILFCVYYYVNNLSQARSLYSEALGMWWDFRYFTIAEMIGNISLNIILGKHMGINGILIATIITAFCSSFLCITNVVFKKYFVVSPKEYYIQNIIYAFVTLCGSVITGALCSIVENRGILGFVVKLLICISFSGFYLFLSYWLIKRTRSYIIAARQIISWMGRK